MESTKKKLFTSKKVDNTKAKKFNGKITTAAKNFLKLDRPARLIQVS
jgi:hypothetical protein